MTLEITLQAVQALIVPIVGYGVMVMRGVGKELRTLNGRMIRIETWKTDHDGRHRRDEQLAHGPFMRREG